MVAAATAARGGGGRGEGAAVGEAITSHSLDGDNIVPTTPGGMGSALSISALLHSNFDDIYDSPPSPGPHISSPYVGDSNPWSNTVYQNVNILTNTHPTVHFNRLHN